MIKFIFTLALLVTIALVRHGRKVADKQPKSPIEPHHIKLFEPLLKKK